MLLEAQTKALVAVADATSSAHVSATEREQLKLAETALLLREELAQARAEFMASIRNSLGPAQTALPAADATSGSGWPQQSNSKRQDGQTEQSASHLTDPLARSLQEAFESEGVMLSDDIIQGMVAACRTRPSTPPTCAEAEAARGVSPRSLKIRSLSGKGAASHPFPAGKQADGAAA